MDLIQSQGLKPREALPSEAKLAAKFGVNRPVVREALKPLAGQGIIEIVNGKGAVIRPVDGNMVSTFFCMSQQHSAQ